MRHKHKMECKGCGKQHTIWFDMEIPINEFSFQKDGKRNKNDHAIIFVKKNIVNFFEDKTRHKLANIMAKYSGKTIEYNQFKREFFEFTINLINANKGTNPADLILVFLENWYWLITMTMARDGLLKFFDVENPYKPITIEIVEKESQIVKRLKDKRSKKQIKLEERKDIEKLANEIIDEMQSWFKELGN